MSSPLCRFFYFILVYKQSTQQLQDIGELEALLGVHLWDIGSIMPGKSLLTMKENLTEFDRMILQQLRLSIKFNTPEDLWREQLESILFKKLPDYEYLPKCQKTLKSWVIQHHFLVTHRI